MDIDDFYERSIPWNPWHGCHRVSPGCLNCYMFRGNERRGVEWSDTVTRSDNQFDMPLSKGRNGMYRHRDCIFMTSMSSDFFIQEADEWREDAWRIMRKRSDAVFMILTKRPERILSCLPKDWGDSGYPNVRLSVSVEDQESWDRRVPLLTSVPAAHRDVFMSPMIGPVDTDFLLSEGDVDAVYLGGEYCDDARPCRYEWVLEVRDSCVRNKVSFHWRNCGSTFVKDGQTYNIPSIADQSRISRSMGLDTMLETIIRPPVRTIQTRLQ